MFLGKSKVKKQTLNKDLNNEVIEGQILNQTENNALINGINGWGYGANAVIQAIMAHSEQEPYGLFIAACAILSIISGLRYNDCNKKINSIKTNGLPKRNGYITNVGLQISRFSGEDMLSTNIAISTGLLAVMEMASFAIDPIKHPDGLIQSLIYSAMAIGNVINAHKNNKVKENLEDYNKKISRYLR